MRCFVMFVTAVCVLFLLKLKSPKNKSFYGSVFLSPSYFSYLFTTHISELLRVSDKITITIAKQISLTWEKLFIQSEISC